MVNSKSVSKSRAVYLLVLSGSLEKAQELARRRFQDCETIQVSKRELREGGWKHQIRELRKLNGEALFVFVNSVEDIQEPLLLKLTIMLHGCRTTLIADSHGKVITVGRREICKLMPQAVLSLVADLLVFLIGWLRLLFLRSRLTAVKQFEKSRGSVDLAFLYPFPMDRADAGGALSHVAGFLSGALHHRAKCEIFSGRPFPFTLFPVHEYPNRRRWYLFRESLALSYNQRFADAVAADLGNKRPSFLYQRHGRYVVAGALLARRLRCPFVLEYNASEVWMAQRWDPTRFLPWLRLCEEISLSAASLIVVVSDVLKQQLMERGIAEDKILVNPNAVDPDTFHPDCGGQELRQRYGFRPDQIVVGFIGSFSYWHGIAILQDAIKKLLQEQERDPGLPQLGFLLIGDGPLRAEMSEALEIYRNKGWVVFTGSIPHYRAPAYLDCSDILVSPHIPMHDGKPFFGSPTKLFEYMAMGKAIVASNLDQLARVLTHQETAWLVEPGNAGELAAAVRLLASNAEMRAELGNQARQAALARHTWSENAARVLSRFDTSITGSPVAGHESRRVFHA